MKLRDHDLAHKEFGALKRAHADLDCRLDIGDHAREEHDALPSQSISQPHLQYAYLSALDACIGCVDGGGDSRCLDDAEGIRGFGLASAAHRLHYLRVNVWEVDEVHCRLAADMSAGSEGFFHRCYLAPDHHQVLPWLDRAGDDHLDRGAFDHGVGSLDAGGYASEFEKSQGRFVHLSSSCPMQRHTAYTMRNESLSTQRRMRLKLMGFVIPSPVGLAMVKEQNPSPENPTPANEGPFLTNMLQSISLAMRLR